MQQGNYSYTFAHLSDRYVFMFLGACLFLVYAPALSTHFAFRDDYTYLQILVDHDFSKIKANVISQGRPLAYWIAMPLLTSLRDIPSILYMRLFGLIGVIFLSLCVYKSLRLGKWSFVEAISITLIISTMPAFYIYVCWPLLSSIYPLAGIITYLAYRCAIQFWQSKDFRTQKGWFAVSTLLLAAGLLIYQPIVMLYWVFVSIHLLRSQNLEDRLLHRFALLTLPMIIALPIGYEAFRFGMALYGPSSPTRASMTLEPFVKVSIFFHVVLPQALNGFYLSQSWISAGILAAFITVGLILHFRKEVGQRIQILIVVLCLIPLTYLPSLVAAENWPSYRTQVALTALLILYFALAVKGFLTLLLPRRDYRTDRFTGTILSTIAFISCLWASINVNYYIVVPQTTELQIMRSHFVDRDLSSIENVYFIQASPLDSPTVKTFYDEFGLPSSASPWVPEPAVRLILRELAPEKSLIPITVVPPGSPINPPDKALVVDMRDLRKLRLP